MTIDVSALRDNCESRVIFKPVVKFLVDGEDIDAKTITLTDDSAYPDGDSRGNLNFELFDINGKKIEYQMTTSEETINLFYEETPGDGQPNVPEGFRADMGVKANVTVVTTNGLERDGSAHDINYGRTEGYFDVEY